MRRFAGNLNLLLVVGLIIGLLAPIFAAPQPVYAQSWLSDYAYRQKFSISGNVTDYAINMTIQKGAGTSSGSTVYLDSHALNWGGTFPNDIRFTQSDGSTELDYWIEDSDASTAEVWVEYDVIGVDPTNFYIYYGKSGAADASSGSDTFLYFDDFNRADNEDVGEGWYECSPAYMDGEIQSNQLAYNTTAGSCPDPHLNHTQSFTNSNIIVHYDAKAPDYGVDSKDWCWFLSDEDAEDNGWFGFRFVRQADSSLDTQVLGDSGWTTVGNYTAGTWYQWEIKYDDSDRTVDYLLDGVEVISGWEGHGSASYANYSNALTTGSGMAPSVWCYSDNIFIRKWADPAPQWEVWYSEESTTVSVTTSAAAYEGTTTATLNGELTSMGPYNITYCYFQYGTTTSYGTNTTEQAKYSTGAFVQGLYTLDPSTVYHYRAAVRYDTSQYAYGSDVTFNTEAEGDWYGAYAHRQSFNLDKTTTRTNYPYKVIIHKGTGTSYGVSDDENPYAVIYLQNHALSWTGTVPNDIRFTNSDNIKLDYWRESSTSTQATVWVEPDSISSTPATFHIYYGLADDTEAPDGPATFTFFDDFESYTIDTSLSSQSTWEDITGGDMTETAQVKLVDGKKMVEMSFNNERPKHAIAFGSGADAGRVVVASIYKVGPAELAGISMCDGTFNGYMPSWMDGYSWLFFATSNTYHQLLEGDGSSTIELDKEAGTSASNTYYQVDARWYGTNLKGLVDGTEKLSASDATYSSKAYLTLLSGGSGGSCDCDWDWIFVRQYDGETITVGSWIGEGGAAAPTVTTGSPTGEWGSGATLWGDITGTGNATVTRRGFDYGRVMEPFSFVIIPDSQDYTRILAYSYVFGMETQWIVDNIDTLNIKAVFHVGDIVNIGDQESEWVIADAAMDKLDGVVPYAVLPGNHDHDIYTWPISAERHFENYNIWFGPDRFLGYDWYGGTFAPGNNANNYMLFEAGGLKWLGISLEFAPNDAMLNWANDLIDNHPDRLVVVSTHNYMYWDETRQSPPDVFGPTWESCYIEDGNDGEEMWTELVSKHSNIVLVVSGHQTVDGCGRMVDYVDGEPIHQILANFQGGTYIGESVDPPGGGWLRIYTFYPNQNKIEATTYSPYWDEYLTDWERQFTLDFRSAGSGFADWPYSVVEEGTYSTGTYSIPVTGLDPNVEYQCRAKAYNGEWGYGATKLFETTEGGEPTIPGAPIDFGTSSTETQINLSWDKGTGAYRTLVRYSTDTYPTRSTGQEIYFGTGESYPFTIAEVGRTYLFSAWSEAGGYYSVEPEHTEGMLSVGPTPGDFPRPTTNRIEDARVFRNFLENGDLLMVVTYKILYEVTPVEDIRDYFTLKVLDGTTLKSQGVPTQWGYRPASIYQGPINSWEWGSEYTVELAGRAGKFEDPDSWESVFAITSGCWIGDDLDVLDTWVIATADRIESYYGDILTVETARGTRALNTLGGRIFEKAIPGLREVRPDLFSTGAEKIDIDTEKREMTYVLGLNATEAIGEENMAKFGALGSYLGDAPGPSILAGLWWLLSLALAGIAFVVCGGNLGAGLIAGVLVALAGGALGFIALTILIPVALVLLIIFVVQQVLAGI